MFEKKDAPELYELLRKNRIQVGKPPVSASSTSPSKQEPAVKSDSSSYTVPELTSPRPYPKFKASFGPAIPRSAATPVTHKDERKVAFNYNTLIFVVVILAIIVFVAYAVGRQWSTGGTAPTDSHEAVTPTQPDAEDAGTHAPAPVAKTYSIRLIYYEDNAVGQKSAERIIKFLNEKNVNGVFSRPERIQGKNQIVIYVGRYPTKEEAIKQRDKYKKLDMGFRNCDVVEGK